MVLWPGWVGILKSRSRNALLPMTMPTAHDSADRPAPQKCPPPASLTALPLAAWPGASSSCPNSSLHIWLLKAEENKETFSWLFSLCIRIRGEKGMKVIDNKDGRTTKERRNSVTSSFLTKLL